MLQIIFLILKIIGIILASIIGLLLITVFLLLFVPIRYRLYGKKDETIQGSIMASWLLRFLYFTLHYKDNQLVIKLRLLGITIKSNQRIRKKRNKKKDSKRHKEKKDDFTQPVEKIIETSDRNEVGNVEEKRNQVIMPLSSENKERKHDNVQQAEPRDKKRISLFDKIMERFKNVISTMKDVICRIIEAIQDIISKTRSVGDVVTELRRKIDLLKAFMNLDINRKGIQLVFTSVRKLLKHVFSKRVKGNIRFGTGDPCSTGQAFGVISIAYSYYGDSIQVTPDFENECFEGDLQAKGRIRLFVLLIIGIKLLFNDNFKQLIRNYNKLKEAL